MKVYLSPSLQDQNVGVGDFGIEMTRAFQVANLVATYLKAQNIPVRMSQRAWSALPSGELLAKVVADSNTWGSDVHVCLHTNAGPPDADGTMVLHYPGSAKGLRLAGLIYKYLAPISPGTDYGLRTTPLFYETKNVHGVVAYVEAAFHSNPAEAKDYVFARKLYAWAIAAGILEYAGKTVPVKPLASFEFLRVPIPMRPPLWWKALLAYLARVKKTG